MASAPRVPNAHLVGVLGNEVELHHACTRTTHTVTRTRSHTHGHTHTVTLSSPRGSRITLPTRPPSAERTDAQRAHGGGTHPTRPGAWPPPAQTPRACCGTCPCAFGGRRALRDLRQGRLVNASPAPPAACGEARGAPEAWDGAEGAGVVAPLGHAQVGRVAGRQAHAVPLGAERHGGLAHLLARTHTHARRARARRASEVRRAPASERAPAKQAGRAHTCTRSGAATAPCAACAAAPCCGPEPAGAGGSAGRPMACRRLLASSPYLSKPTTCGHHVQHRAPPGGLGVPSARVTPGTLPLSGEAAALSHAHPMARCPRPTERLPCGTPTPNGTLAPPCSGGGRWPPGARHPGAGPHHVCLWEVGGQLPRVALRQAARHDDLAALAVLVQRRGVHDGLRVRVRVVESCICLGTSAGPGPTRRARACVRCVRGPPTPGCCCERHHCAIRKVCGRQVGWGAWGAHLEGLGLGVLDKGARVDDDGVGGLVLLGDLEPRALQVA